MQSSRQPSLIRPNAFDTKDITINVGEKKRAYGVTGLRSSSLSHLWDVKSRNLRKPIWMILEPTHAVIMNTDVSAIADRIVRVNKELSVKAEYDSKKARASLQTSEGIEITVNMYTTGKKLGRPGIIVEIQRFSGCSVTFRKYCNPILAAAKGKLNISQLCDSHSPEPAIPEYPSDLKERRSLALDGIEMAKNLLEQESYDAQYLGLQSLENMTDAKRSGIIATLTASRAVLSHSTNERDEAIQSALSKILHDLTPSEKRIRLNDSTKSIQYSTVSVLINKTLSLLSNSLNVIRTHGKEGELHHIYENLSEKNILNKLWDILGYSEQYPHEALYAARCLYVLVTAYPTAQSSESYLEKRAVVDEACSVGMLSHSALFRECKGLLEIL